MPAPSFTTGQVLTAAEMNQLAEMDVFGTAVAGSVNPCVAGTLYIITNGPSSFTFTLPAPTAGIAIGFKKADSGAGLNTITAGSGVILGPGTGSAGSASIPCSALGAYVVLQGDGTNWHIVAGQQDSGWVPLTYSNSWVSSGGPASGATAAGYRLIGNEVRLGGAIKSGTNAATAFTLPAGARPPTNVNVLVMSLSTGGLADYLGSISITAAGAAEAQFTAAGFLQLNIDGVDFTVD